MATISLRVDAPDAKLKNTFGSDLMRNAVIEEIEDELDVENFDRIHATMEKTHSMDDIKKELGL